MTGTFSVAHQRGTNCGRTQKLATMRYGSSASAAVTSSARSSGTSVRPVAPPPARVTGKHPLCLMVADRVQERGDRRLRLTVADLRGWEPNTPERSRGGCSRWSVERQHAWWTFGVRIRREGFTSDANTIRLSRRLESRHGRSRVPGRERQDQAPALARHPHLILDGHPVVRPTSVPGSRQPSARAVRPAAAGCGPRTSDR